MTINDFMKAMRQHFGEFEFRAVSPQGEVIKSSGWPDNPKHPVNATDNKFKTVSEHNAIASGSVKIQKTYTGKGKRKIIAPRALK